MGQRWVTPAEFWKLAPGEVWWLIDAMKPQQPKGDVEDLYEMMRAEQERERTEADG